MEQNYEVESRQSLFSLTWPIFIEVFLYMIMGNADTIMLSRVSDQAVAAVGVTNQLISIAIVMFGFVASGAGVVISQYIGAKKEKEAIQVGAISLGINFLFGFTISMVMFFFSSSFLLWMNVPVELRDFADQYFQIVGGFLFIQAILMTASAQLRSNGFTKDTMFVSLGMNILNIIGNLLFIFGLFGFPKLGVTGVAISTSVSRVIGLIVILLILSRRLEHRFRLREFFRFKKEYVKQVLKIGIPAAGENLSYDSSQVMITFFITMMGTAALTTKVYTQTISMFIFLFSVSVAQGTQILVGYLVGARKNEDAYHTALRSLKMSMLVSVVVATLFWILGNPLFHLFTHDDSIIQLGLKLLMINIMLEIGRTFNLVLISSLRATGDATFPVVMGVISMWGVSVSLSYLLGIVFNLGLVGVWISFAMDEWIRGILMFFRWKSRIWEKKVLFQQTHAING
ncbi:MATE family efflux transporter [Tepidibacillus marianensis]|uniref:MATE family efflux transporter n=1 Tax=Tepidibacillus marianensis TaxID=3131995 RepID=UPI0030CA8FA3